MALSHIGCGLSIVSGIGPILITSLFARFDCAAKKDKPDHRYVDQDSEAKQTKKHNHCANPYERPEPGWTYLAVHQPETPTERLGLRWL